MHQPKPSIRCKLAQSGGTWMGYATIDYPGIGRFNVSEMVQPGEMRALEARYCRKLFPKMMARSPELKRFRGAVAAYHRGAITAGFFGKLWRKVKKAVKKTWRNVKLTARAIVNKKARRRLWRKLKNGIKKVGRIAAKVYKHPIFAGLVATVATVVPGAQGLGIAYGISRAAIKLVNQVKNGDPAALETIGQIGQMAAQGDPKAKAALKVYRQAYRNPKKLMRNVARATKKAEKRAPRMYTPKGTTYAIPQNSGYWKLRQRLLARG